MQTTLDMALGAATHAVGNLQHVHRVAEAMHPDPREWAYTGQVVDGQGMGAHCACGHPIRFIFVVARTRDGQQLPIGSTCITSTVPYLLAEGAVQLASSLQRALAVHEQALAALEKARRAAEQDAACQTARQEWQAVRERGRVIIDGYRANGRRIPYPLWMLWNRGAEKIHCCPHYARVSSSTRWYQQAVIRLRETFGHEGYQSL